MIILAVDHGDVRTGIAVCDATETLASPVCSLTERNEDRLLDSIISLAEKYGACQIVVGLPKNMDGSCGESAQKCRAFAKRLQETGQIETVLRDERLTTVSAHQALNAVNSRGKKRKSVVDQVAAVMILQEYLDYRKNQTRMG